MPGPGRPMPRPLVRRTLRRDLGPAAGLSRVRCRLPWSGPGAGPTLPGPRRQGPGGPTWCVTEPVTGTMPGRTSRVAAGPRRGSGMSGVASRLPGHGVGGRHPLTGEPDRGRSARAACSDGLSLRPDGEVRAGRPGLTVAVSQVEVCSVASHGEFEVTLTATDSVSGRLTTAAPARARGRAGRPAAAPQARRLKSGGGPPAGCSEPQCSQRPSDRRVRVG